MVPFRVFDRENKEMWIVLNYHPGAAGDEGSYLLAREDDSEKDGEIALVAAKEFTRFRLVDFLDEGDGYDD
jgi:hypothetical protein